MKVMEATWTSPDGSVRLFLGDCRDITPFVVTTTDSVVTDPPFGMAFVSNFRIERYDAIANDHDPELLAWACTIPVRHSRYVFCRWDNLVDVPKPKSLVTWVKNNWSMGDLEHEHARQTEVALYWPGESHRWPHKRPTDVVWAPRTGNDNHPTEKPVELMETFVRWTEGVVFDPFMGSGSTGVACARLGRPFVGIEREPVYFETAKRRIQDALGLEVKRKDGVTQKRMFGMAENGCLTPAPPS